MSILCGTDFTPHATEAVEVAAALAARAGELLVLVHAVECPGAEPARERLRAEVARLSARHPGLVVDTHVASGLADEMLVRLAGTSPAPGEGRTRPARLIVVASLGRRDAARWALGSVAERTAKTAPVPVLVVRESGPFTSWLRGDRRLRVVVGFDFSAAATAALRWASELCGVAPCDVLVATVTSPPRRHGQSGAEGSREDVSQFETILRNDLGIKIREHAWKDCRPEVRVRTGPTGRATALAELAADERADLLVVGSRQMHGSDRLWEESVSRGTLYQAATSVACVPATAAEGRERSRRAKGTSPEDEATLSRRLESHPFLRGVSGDVLRRIASIAREDRVPRGSMLLREGGEADTFFLLESGLVVLEVAVPGRGTTVLESLHGGDVVGLSWLFPTSRWHLDARVVEPATVLAIDARRLREWMEADATIGQAVATRLVRQVYERLERVRLQRLALYQAEPS